MNQNQSISSPRLRRLINDYKEMKKLVKQSDLISFETEGEPPERYIVTYKVKGLKWNELQKEPTILDIHKVEIYLHIDYPRTRPILQWLTPIFHPNIDKSGWVCIGGWAPSESLSELVIRLGEMIQYKNYDEKNCVNEEAALWVRHNKHKLPIDKTQLLKELKKDTLLLR